WHESGGQILYGPTCLASIFADLLRQDILNALAIPALANVYGVIQRARRKNKIIRRFINLAKNPRTILVTCTDAVSSSLRRSLCALPYVMVIRDRHGVQLPCIPYIHAKSFE